MTRNGIEYNLAITPYRFTSNYGFTFCFSSQNHLSKFIEMKREHRTKINVSLTNRFGFGIRLNEIADIVLYKKIENRGFLIQLAGGNEITCLDNITLSGVTKIKLDCPTQCDSSTPKSLVP